MICPNLVTIEQLKNLLSTGDFHSTTSYHSLVEHNYMSKRAVFLDRDGVICKDRNDYVKSWDEFVWIPKARDALRRLNDNRHIVIVITNQSAVGRGLTSQEAVEDIHRRMMKSVSQAGGRIERVYYCPHRPEDECSCRKPKSGLLVEAAKDCAIDLKKSYLVGDSPRDIEAGHRVQCTTIMINPDKTKDLPKDKSYPDYIVSDLSEAVELILRLDSAGR